MHTFGLMTQARTLHELDTIVESCAVIFASPYHHGHSVREHFEKLQDHMLNVAFTDTATDDTMVRCLIVSTQYLRAILSVLVSFVLLCLFYRERLTAQISGGISKKLLIALLLILRALIMSVTPQNLLANFANIFLSRVLYGPI